MKIMVDTNVVLDVFLDRKPHSANAIQIFGLIEEGRVGAFLCATTITILDYLLTQSLRRDDVKKHLAQLIGLFEIAPVNRAVIEGAMKSQINDFEDAVMDQAAFLIGADAVVTRNSKDFVKGVTKVLDPKEFLVQTGN